MASEKTRKYGIPLLLFVCALLLGLCSIPAQASFVPIFVSAENGTYNYLLRFSSAQGSEQLGQGAYITFYDIAAPGTVSDVSPTGDDLVLLQLVGQTPAPLAAVVDDPGLLNLTVVYQGLPYFTDIAYPLSFTITGGGDATRAGTFGSVNSLTVFPSQFAQSGGVLLPTLVPEPLPGGLLVILLMMRLGASYREKQHAAR